MRQAPAISLVAIAPVTGLPVLMAMPGMARRHGCGQADVSVVCLLAVLAVGVAMLLLLVVRPGRGDDRSRARWRMFLLARPPRLA